MIKSIAALSILLTFTGVAVSQGKVISEPRLERAELISPWHFEGTKGVYVRSRRPRTCLDLSDFKQICDGSETLSYGNRVGNNWDIFAISGGIDSRSRMVDLGERKWDDAFDIPEVEPWPALKPGETRMINVNTSGADGKDGQDGADGMPGRNADGTFPTNIPRQPASKRKQKPRQNEDLANASLNRQVTSKIMFKGKVIASSNYTPMTEVKKGHMYLIRVVYNGSDHYVLMRVDDLVRGSKVNLSYFSFGFAL